MRLSEQEREVSAVKQHVSREQLVSCMNSTKWNELIEIMDKLPADKCPAWRCKGLLSDELSGWDLHWHDHMPQFISIEWLEFDPIQKKKRGELLEPVIIADRTDFFSDLLKAKGIPHSKEKDLIRVWGYQKPGQTIEFV